MTENKMQSSRVNRGAWAYKASGGVCLTGTEVALSRS